MPILRELITILGFKADTRVLKEYDQKIVSLKKNLFLLTAAAAAVATAIFGITQSAAKFGDTLDKTKDLTGLSVEELQRLRGAASLAGVDVQGLTTGMQLFSRQISQAAQGQQMSTRLFSLMNMNIFGVNNQLKTNHQLLIEVADAFQRMGKTQLRTDMAMQLFGRSGGRMINLLKNGAAGIREAEAEFSKFGFTMNAVQSKAAARFEDRMTMVGFAVKGLKNAIGTALLPQMSNLVQTFLGWFAANKKVIQQNMVKVFKDLSMFVRIVANVFGALLAALTKLVSVFGGWNRALKITGVLLALLISTKILRGFATLTKAVFGLFGVFKKLAIVEGIADALALVWPALAILIVLAIDDIANAIKGNDSITKRLMDRYKTFGKIIRGIVRDLRALKRGLSLGEHPLKNLPKSFATFTQAAMIPLGGGSLAALRQTVPTVAPAAIPTTRQQPTQNTLTNHINTTVNMQVPEGTPEHQKRSLRKTVEQVFDEGLGKHLKEALVRFPVME